MTSPPSKASVPKTFAITGIALFMVALDNLVVTNALPSIRTDLGTGLEGLEWTVNAYTLSFAVLLLTAAAVADRYGRRRLFIGGLAVFTAASAAAALAPSIGVLVAARAVQGVGAAVVLPLTLTILAAAVPPERRSVALAAWSAMSGLGVALGPVVGGAVTEWASWQWIFWINVPVGLVLLALAPGFLTESHGDGRRLDLTGTALVTAGLFGVVYGLVQGNGHGWTSATVLAGLIGGALLLAAFAAYEAKGARQPMLPLELFRSRGFSVVNVIAAMMSFGMFGAVFLLAQYLQFVGGMSPLESGLRTLPWTAMPVLAAPLTVPLVARIGPRNVIVLALAAMAAGIGWLAAMTGPSVDYPAVVPGFVLGGIGMGMFFPPVAQLTLGFAPAELAGVASGVSNALRQLGTVLGVAVLGAVFSANGGFAGPGQFTDGLLPAIWVGTAVVAAAALIALIMPRRLPAHGPGKPVTEAPAEVSAMAR